jgi:cholesterol oxidase
VIASRLAEAGTRVCVLERGKRYPPGSFPRSPRAFAQNFWDPGQGCHGMFDVWSFKGLEAVVASGLGGGSLIYANVMLRKDEHWFYDRDPKTGERQAWPVSRADLDPHYDNVERVLQPTPFPFSEPPYDQVEKTRALREVAATLGPHAQWMLPPLAITFAAPGQRAQPGVPLEGANLHNGLRSTCRLCGECDVGCNYGSKNTLDYTYLSRAFAAGADIRDRCEVKRLKPRFGHGGFEVTYADYGLLEVDSPVGSAPRKRITTDRLVLSAGTLGSTFLLLKNNDSLKLGPALGTRFCGNGDFLGFVLGGRRSLDPDAGPVITAAIRVDDTEDGGDGPGYYVEDGGTPAFANWITVAQPSLATVRRVARFAFRRVRAKVLGDPQSDLSGEVSALFGRPATILPLLGMGRDQPDGTMSLRRGNLAIDWTTKTSESHFARVEGTMREIAQHVGAELRTNPLWRWHRVVTVHPLGGCPIGDDARSGVVNTYGQVFGHPGLYVADGSVVPGPVGANPSLTIAALADRFADRMLA